MRYWWITRREACWYWRWGWRSWFGENTRSNVATFFGVYWIRIGALAIRWALSPDREGIPALVLISGVAGLTTGVVVLARSLFESLFGTGFAI